MQNDKVVVDLSLNKSETFAKSVIKIDDENSIEQEYLQIRPMIWLGTVENLETFYCNFNEITKIILNPEKFDLFLEFTHLRLSTNKFYTIYNDYYKNLNKKTLYHSILYAGLLLSPDGKVPSIPQLTELCYLFMDIFFASQTKLNHQIQKIYNEFINLLEEANMNIIIPALNYFASKCLNIETKTNENRITNVENISTELFEYIFTLCPLDVVIRSYHYTYHNKFSKIGKTKNNSQTEDIDDAINTVLHQNQYNIEFLTHFVDFIHNLGLSNYLEIPEKSNKEEQVDNKIKKENIFSNENVKKAFENYAKRQNQPKIASPKIPDSENEPTNTLYVANQFLNFKFPQISEQKEKK